ncbi:MAG: BlaI/MecI/CopY family transcriptional regulator [Verrucomicrobiales bacterium]
MPDSFDLSRRERQIMDAVFALGEATVNQVVEAIPSPPTPMAVRRMMHILEEKGHLRRRESGREVVYLPRQAKGKAGRLAFEQVLETFFGGSLEEALAAHLHSRKDQVSVDERQRLIALIEKAQQEGR